MAKTVDITRSPNGAVVVTINGNARTLSNPENVQIKQYYGIDDEHGLGSALLGLTIKSPHNEFYVKITTLDTFTINGTTAPTVIPDQIYILANYIFSGPSVVSEAFVKLNQTITFVAPASVPHTNPAFQLVGTSSSGLPVSFASSDNTKFTCTGPNGATLTPVGAGSANITASQAGNTWYNAATNVVVPYALT